MNIFWYILLGLIAFLPIVLWGYSFAFISDNPLNKKRFFVGIFAGVISVFPIVYMENILSFFSFEKLHVLYTVAQVENLPTSILFSFSLALFLGIIALISFLSGGFLLHRKKALGLYMRVFFILLGISALISLFVLLVSFIPIETSLDIQGAPVFSDIFFNTLKLIVFYYVIVAFIEEASKHFNFLQTSGFEITNLKNGVESAIFVALGFSFIENLLYLYNYMQIYSGGELFKIYFFRSVFSVIVHVTCSSIVAYYFSKAFLKYKENNESFPFIKVFLLGMFASIFFHLVYDVALSLGFSIVLFLYFVGGYLYVSSIFYGEE